MSAWEDQLTGLVSSRGAALARFGYLLSGDDQEAVDLVQEALVRVSRMPVALMGRQSSSVANGSATVDVVIDAMRARAAGPIPPSPLTPRGRSATFWPVRLSYAL